MPITAKAQAVPVEQEESNREGLAVAMDVPDEKTDAEQLTEVINEVNVSNQILETKYVSPVKAPIETKSKRSEHQKQRRRLSLPKGLRTTGRLL